MADQPRLPHVAPGPGLVSLEWSPLSRTDDDRSVAVLVDSGAQRVRSVVGVHVTETDAAVTIDVLGTRFTDEGPMTLASILGEHISTCPAHSPAARSACRDRFSCPRAGTRI
ncbi:hypothetical protein SAMN05421810_10711 [Amycolatopsis arida]|uniref:Uncharacterized protein n=1 Tax=Amycolatopsis arida TaxID=587909 RepID=A0A1I5Y969_9PSEU|nr:hypothetical protein [Amycolatopsis arida]TDX90367.1 hypothetical protein CLV69_10711 [Amycolatopsis arida]SFQ40734.1 hypothetical protein SAMN05421810_10711 [Amycolatopsis arida]